jgi:predicted TIM-barrel fold metal-dependent hydrolase
MFTRREMLGVMGAAALGSRAMAEAQRKSAVGFEVPAGACDCHAHVFGDPARFPFVASRTYTPAPATVPELNALHRALGIDRVVVVHASVYGTDNSATLDAMKQLGSRARGVAVIDEKTPDAALKAMNDAGIRGIRVNLGTAGVTDPAVGRERFRAAVARAKAMDWHIQVFTQLPMIQALRDDVLASGLPVVFDHFGSARPSTELRAGGLGAAQPGFDVLLDLVRRGSAYVKISAPYRCSNQAPDYPDMAPLARALISANADRILWGTDWPHPDTSSVPGRKVTDIAPFLPIDDGRVLAQLAVWAPDANIRKKILVENPSRLYGF